MGRSYPGIFSKNAQLHDVVWGPNYQIVIQCGGHEAGEEASKKDLMAQYEMKALLLAAIQGRSI